MSPASVSALQLRSVEAEATTRLRLAAAVSVVAELILPTVEAIFFSHPDWLAIEIQSIWFALTLALWTATWHPRFGRFWKPTVLLFAAGLILSAGVLSVKGASLAPFMFLLVLLPAGGTILPWEPEWQAGMSCLCVVFGLSFSSQFDWRNHLVISGLSAMVASILGAHLVTVALTRQRRSINNYLQALTHSEEKFRKIFETSSLLIAIHTLPDGRLVDVNPAWERTFGYSREEVLGKVPGDFGLTPDPVGFVQWSSKLKIGDAGAERIPVVLRARYGNPVHCVYSWATIELNGRDCVFIEGQDITARIEAEEALRLNRAVLVNQERLKTVGELASGIAHDLNNSLNALRLRVELLCSDPVLISRHNDSLQLISRIVRDAASTIGRVQDFARRGDDRQIANLDLNAIIRQSVEIAKSTLEERNSLLGRSIRVELNLPGLPLTAGEPAELRQVFLNLLLNAQDAMPAGGTIRITATVQNRTIVVTVEDEGHGIPEANLGRIFDPFFSTKGENGTGLGLSIAAAAMTRIGGTIRAANRAAGGAVFTLEFPIAFARSLHEPQDDSSNIEPRRVMVVEDDPDNLQALSALLESRGHAVMRTRSSVEALEELTHSRVDVVLCDLGMRELNGWELARQVKSLNEPPRFFLLTGWAAEIRADDPRRDSVDGVLTKPIDPKILDDLMAAKKPEKSQGAEPTEKRPLLNGSHWHAR